MNTFEQARQAEIVRTRAHMDEHIARLDWTREQIEAEQLAGLRKTLAYAKEHSPFYAKRLAHVDPESFNLGDLATIPPLTKTEIMTHWDDIVTDPALTLEKANQHLAALRDGRSNNFYYNDKYYLSATGGSSGHRGLFVWDTELFQTTSAITYRMEAAHDRLHPRPADAPKRTAVICAGTYLHASRMVFPQSPDPEREIQVFQAGSSIHTLVQDLNEFQPDRIVSYSSAIEQLCNEAKRGRLHLPHMNRITVNSEPLSDETRVLAREVWGIDIHNSWGCVELGLTAVEGEHFEGMSLAEDFLIFEAADADGNVIVGKDDGPADHLLVTRLFGNTMPLIRYKLTDSPVLTSVVGPDAPFYRRITEIRGRADVWFAYNNGKTKIHPMLFRSVLGQFAKVLEYQVRQTKHGACVDLLSDGTDIDTATIHTALVGKLKDGGLNMPEIRVQVVEELMRHPETNKLTRFVQLAKDQRSNKPIK